MKNKKAAILLLVLAAGIWSMVIYRIFNAVQHSDHVSIAIPETRQDIFSSLSDTFSIVADYRDPFLGKRIVMQAPKKTVPAVVKPKPAPVAVNINWPPISYAGIIKNQNSAKELALVKIDQKDFIMKAGDIMLGVELTKVFKDSIVVFYQREKKVISK